MKYFYTHWPFSGDTRIWHAGLLTLVIYVLFPFSQALASYQDIVPAAEPMTIGRPTDTIAADEERHQRTKLMLNYLKEQGATLMPSLSDMLRSSKGWATYGVQALENQFDFSDDADKGDPEKTILATHPVSSIMQPPSGNDTRPYWISSGWHHKSGVLPFHDAMVLGFNSRHPVLDNRMQVELHPYYAQHCVGLNGYYGTEVSVGLRNTDSAEPWGKIAMGYVNGESSLTDRGRGYDMHSEVKFDDHLSFHTGVRQNENTDLGNYMMLRWKLAGE